MSSAPQIVLAALVGAAFGLLAFGVAGPTTAPRTQLLYTATSAATRPLTAPRTAPLAAPLAAARPQSQGLQAPAPVPSAGASAPATPSFETVQGPEQGSSVAWLALASVFGAVGGFFAAKKADQPESTPLPLAAVPSRRQALTQMATGVAAVGLSSLPAPAYAAYGDSANVFGKKAPVDQMFKVSGPGWSTSMPGKYNPSKEREYEGTVGRWFEEYANASVIVNPTSAKSTTDLGDQAAVLEKYITPLLGVQSFEGSTISEGGFAPGQVSIASLLGQDITARDGQTYYEYELLSRTADGDEGGKHQLYSVAVAGGKVFILRHQVGDKKWFKGGDRQARTSIAEFTVA